MSGVGIPHPDPHPAGNEASHGEASHGFDKRIAFIGGGNMAEAILSGLLTQQTLKAHEILVSEPNKVRRGYLKDKYGTELIDDNVQAVKRSSTVVLAIKPQMLDVIKGELKPLFTKNHILVSILAGASRKKLMNAFGSAPYVVRVMPNLPAQVGMGISAITFPETITDDLREWVKNILQSVGKIIEIDEPLQDVVTAVSGSGPGYLFYFAHCFIQAAIKEGLDEQSAFELVTQTMAGAAEVLKQSPDTAETLVSKVATPGGTTQAGLSALKDFDLAAIMLQTVERAARRSRELNSEQ